MENIPVRFLYPTVTRARELIAAGGSLSSAKNLRRVLDLPLDLASADLSSNERKAVERFLKWAKLNEVHSSYVANHRRSWWSVQLRSPAVILCTYMARRAPTFVLNKAGARHLNIAHGLYPREPMSEGLLSALLTYLHRTVTTSGGRTYAGGLVKFEPKELERLRVPALHRLHEQVADQWTLAELQADAATAKANFRRERLDEPLDLYNTFYGEFSAIFADIVSNLSTIMGDPVDAKVMAGLLTGHKKRKAFRYLAAPPISEDDLESVADTSIAPTGIARDLSKATLVRDTMRSILDPHRFPWIAVGAIPTQEELHNAVMASAAMAAAREVESFRRNNSKTSQEKAVKRCTQEHKFD